MLPFAVARSFWKKAVAPRVAALYSVLKLIEETAS